MSNEHIIKGIVRHYWNEDHTHTPYVGVLHELDDKSQREWVKEINDFLSAQLNGAEIEIIVKSKSVHEATFGYEWKLTKPHTYERVKL